MAQRKGEGATKKILSPSTLPASTRKMVVVKSITKEEIDRFWRRKKMVEEEHLLAAQKAAARIRAKALKEEDFRRFEELLREIIDGEKSEEEGKEGDGGDDGNNKELRIGIKDWWTKSKYAYLNQPAIKSIDDHAKNGSNTYLPQKSCFIFNSPALYGNCTAYSGVF